MNLHHDYFGIFFWGGGGYEKLSKNLGGGVQNLLRFSEKSSYPPSLIKNGRPLLAIYIQFQNFIHKKVNDNDIKFLGQRYRNALYQDVDT